MKSERATFIDLAWQAPQVELGLHESMLTPAFRELAAFGDRVVVATVDEADQAHTLTYGSSITT